MILAVACSACGGDSAWARAQGASPNAPDVAQDDSSDALEVFEGEATYYANSLAGNRTANGEVYRPGRFTAASRDLPFGTVVRVRRHDAKRTVTVRINDRGPFGDHRRIIDLSRAAAKKLGMLDKGVVPVRVEVLRYPQETDTD